MKIRPLNVKQGFLMMATLLFLRLGKGMRRIFPILSKGRFDKMLNDNVIMIQP